jgi:putative secretion ATPase (PEP-CTERM system associated)
MYERFYNLRERPFSLSPDPDYLYPSRVHREALGYLRYGIEGHAGFVLITGDIGCGKTTMLQTVLRGLDRQTSVSRLVNTMLDARDLIEAVMLDFGLDPGQGRSKPHLMRDLARYLVDQRMAGRLALLVIDEAQNLSLSALEEVRMLSNLETEKSKLIQIILVGQPNLRDLLARPELEQLRQRVTVSYHLQPLGADETAAYINHRLRRAAIGAPLEFSRDVTDLIHQSSEGIPRKINVIADAILLFGYGEERRSIDVDLTREVVEELESLGVIVARTGVSAGSAPAGTVVVAPVTPALTAPATPAVTAPATAAAMENTAELAAREARLAEREKQLAEQKQVLLESYQLLRAARGKAAVDAAPAIAPAHAAWPPSRPAPAEPMPSVVGNPSPRTSAMPARPMPALSSSHRLFREPEAAPEGLLTRLYRGLFGLGKPVFEEWKF